MNSEQGGAAFDDTGSGSTAGYGSPDPDAIGQDDDMDDDELLDEGDDDDITPIGDDDDLDNDTTSTGRSDY